MKIITISNMLFSPISLPGMGRSIDLPEVSEEEARDIRDSFSKKELFIEFTENPGTPLRVINLWSNPHSLQFTLFV
jgi:hypothetical protein